MYLIWLMPLLLLNSLTSGSSAARTPSCPHPSQLPCVTASTCDPASSGRCCQTSCGGHLLMVAGRGRRWAATSGGYCDKPRALTSLGCSVCTCKHNRLECLDRGCKGCLVDTGGGNTTSIRHGEVYSKGCLSCPCIDGRMECSHDTCTGCSMEGNVTA
eukprot:sb/3473005/